MSKESSGKHVKTPESLRSARWFAPDDLRSFGHRSRAMQMGYGPEDWVGKPVIGIVNTWSDINPCHSHDRDSLRSLKGKLEGVAKECLEEAKGSQTVSRVTDIELDTRLIVYPIA